ncbi:conserved hypothetical protein [Flavobacterium psychrophilum]|uniref:DUF2851 family protein n=1 Tax=Flavobacterium psychrophilum TaxID=96345 RepID=UPI000B7C1AC9|nr:DUF2851 family protein [Flavobacterium psychrophilum]GEJ34298.1 hypothetical protein FPN184_contig00034-0023 [Flavobacterium psychrophilum]GEJ49085.1 hypothetical protein FPKKA176_contig00021-0010 [Flavobacterium psychrophilum]SNB04718.1 conserved hypothetical protein [Flavobacterium psychrophilum]
MKEDFLHHIWQYKKFDFTNLKTTSGENVSIFNTGNFTQLAGPDFFNAQIEIDNQKWAGNIEIHLKSSDWYIHNHERNEHYDSVILHVVWEHDAAIFRKDNSEIPVLEIKNYVSPTLIHQYEKLKATKSWIYCENGIKNIPSFVFENWKERLFFERLERKSNPIEVLLLENHNDWEATFFCFLAKNFGLNTNGESFFKIAQSVPFSIIRKEAFEVENLEAIFFGRANLLTQDKEDNYFKDLKFRWNYIQNKYQLEGIFVNTVQFFKHRPDNFPTIRLSQLANLHHTHQNLFSKVIRAKNIEELYQIFQVSVSEYWQTHYNFDKISTKKAKSLSKSFVDLLIINTIIPFRFAYEKSLGKETSEENIKFLSQITAEKNTVIDKFKSVGIITKNAFETQSLLQLKKEYCDKSNCLQCAVGLAFLKN